MIPEFDKNGNLPEGIHLATEEEFLDRFGSTSARRKWLGERVREIFAMAKSTGKVKRIFVWGSFVSAKQSPNDIDVLLLMSEDFRLEDVSEDSKHLFDYIGDKIRFHSDVFWCKASIGEDTLAIWLDTYQTTKDFKRRGIVEVI